jgi:hypothetical protein
MRYRVDVPLHDGQSDRRETVCMSKHRFGRGDGLQRGVKQSPPRGRLLCPQTSAESMTVAKKHQRRLLRRPVSGRMTPIPSILSATPELTRCCGNRGLAGVDMTTWKQL